MCEKCEAIDVRIARYRLVLSHVDDQMVVDVIKGFIAKLESEKARLHPERDM